MNKTKIRILCDNSWSYWLFKKCYYWPIYLARDSINDFVKKNKLKYNVL